MASARFTIDSTSPDLRGYDTTAAAVVALRLEVSTGVYSCVYTVVRATKGAPTITLSNGGIASPVSTDVTFTVPAGHHSYLIRCVVNGGVDANSRPVAEYVFERIVAVRSSGLRKIIVAETVEYDPTYGWVEAYNEVLGGSLVGANTGTANTWTEQQTFSGLPFAIVAAQPSQFVGITCTTLSASGAVSVASLSTGGAVSAASLGATGNITAGGTISTSGLVSSLTLSVGTNATIGGTLAVGGNITGSTAGFSGAVSATALTATGAVTGGSLNSAGSLLLTGVSSAITYSGAGTFTIATASGGLTSRPIILSSGGLTNGSTTGNMTIATGNNSAGGGSGDIYVAPGGTVSGARGSISLGTSTPSFGSGQLVVYVPPVAAAPVSNPASGGVLYAGNAAVVGNTAGHLYWRSVLGTFRLSQVSGN